MRILIVSSFFPPLNSIASHRPYSWAKYWSQAGHDVTVLTPEKMRNPKVDLKADFTGFHCVETAPLKLVRFLKGKVHEDQSASSSMQSKPGSSKKFLHFIRNRVGILDNCHMPDITDLWVGPAFKAVSQLEPWDLVISTAPPFPIHRLAYRIKKSGLAKHWIMDYRDLIVGSPVTNALPPFNWIERWLELRYVAASDAVTTISDGLANSLKGRYPQANIHVVANGYEPNDNATLTPEPAYPDDGLFRLVYLGHIYPRKRDPRPLFQAIQELDQDLGSRHLLSKLQVRFYGPEMGDVPELIEKFQVGTWVKLGGFVNRTEALRIQRDANALLFLSWADPSAEGIVTGKLFEYFAAKTPVIAVGAIRADASEALIEEANAGYNLGRDIEAIKSYLVKSLQVPGKEPSNVNQEVLSRYTRATLASDLLKLAISVSTRASTMRSEALPVP